MTQNRMTKIFNASGGCEEDCLNCKYPDCYKSGQAIVRDENKKGEKQ